jgi:hypothetical protein
MVVDACLGGVRRTVPAGMTFERNFLTGSLGAGAVFTRASTGWYTNASGVLVSAATNAPRFDYDPVTLQIKGLLLEDTSTNLILFSGDLSVGFWTTTNNVVALPVVTGNNVASPDGTMTAARIVWPAVSGASAISSVQQQFTATAVPYAFSIHMRGNVGGEQIYLYASTAGTTFYSASRITLTTAWQRFTFITPALTAASWTLNIGTDLRAGGQTSTPAQTVYAWGGQAEVIGYATSHIPTTGAAVTRAADALSYPIASVTGFSTTQGSLAHEYIVEGSAVDFGAVAQMVGASNGSDYISLDEMTTVGETTTAPELSIVSVSAGGSVVGTGYYTPTPIPAGLVHRGAAAWLQGGAINGAHDGVTTVSSSGAMTPMPVISSLTIAGPMHFQAPVSQWARRIRYWPRQLSQAELISVTS